MFELATAPFPTALFTDLLAPFATCKLFSQLQPLVVFCGFDDVAFCRLD